MNPRYNLEADRRKDARAVLWSLAFMAISVVALAVVALDVFVWRP